MNLQEHEFSDAQRKRREDDVWNAAIEAALESFPEDKWGGEYECGWRVALGEASNAILSLKRPVS